MTDDSHKTKPDQKSPFRDPAHMDQGFIDRKTGKFTPAHLQESEEARKKRLQSDTDE